MEKEYKVDKITGMNIINFYMRTMLLFPIATIFDSGILTKILFGILISINMFYLIKKPIKKKTFLILTVMLFNYIFTLLNGDALLYNVNLYFYYPFIFVYTCFVFDKYTEMIEWLKGNYRYIKFVVISWSIIVGVSIFVPSCYYIKEGGNAFFGSWAGSIFRLGPSANFIQVLILILITIHNKKKNIYYMIVPMYCFFMGSSRTYLILGVMIFAICWYYFCKKKRVFWLTLLPIVAVAGYMIFVSAIGDKIAYTIDQSRYGDFWFKITSSRSQFWAIDLAGWLEQPILQKMLGSGLDFTYQLTGLWGHNDFIEILCSMGILGLAEYVYIMLALIKKFILTSYCKKNIFVSICVFMCWFLNAFFNMHYVYFCCVLFYPLLLFVISGFYKEKEG